MEATATAEMLELSAPELEQQQQAVDGGRRPRDPSVSLMNISVDLPRAQTRLDHSLSLDGEGDEGDEHQLQLDLTEDVHQKFWGNTFIKKGFPISMWEDKKTYTHVIIRDPVERLLSAYVNKLSCGLYNVPAGQRGDHGKVGGKLADQAGWSTVVEDTGGYKTGFMKTLGGKTQTIHYKCPCQNNPWMFGDTGHSFNRKSDHECNSTGFASCSCEGVTLDMFAEGIEMIYKRWPQHVGDGASNPFGHRLNAHFTPQTGQNSCFQNVDIEDYDKVSKISDMSAMREFSEHLSEHQHGLWSGQAANAHGHVYFEGSPWHVPGHIVARLKRATAEEYKYLGKYL
jgi:hypothetical protein